MDDARSFIQFCLIRFCVVCHCSLRCTCRIHDCNMSATVSRFDLHFSCKMLSIWYLTELESNQMSFINFFSNVLACECYNLLLAMWKNERRRKNPRSKCCVPYRTYQSITTMFSLNTTIKYIMQWKTGNIGQ